MTTNENSPPEERQEYNDERDMDAFWNALSLRSEPFKQRWYVPAILLLIIVSIPWYRPAGFMGTVIAGLPTWVWVTLLCSVLLAILTAVAIVRYWQDDDDE